jgi:hypothetical protein
MSDGEALRHRTCEGKRWRRGVVGSWPRVVARAVRSHPAPCSPATGVVHARGASEGQRVSRASDGAECRSYSGRLRSRNSGVHKSATRFRPRDSCARLRDSSDYSDDNGFQSGISLTFVLPHATKESSSTSRCGRREILLKAGIFDFCDEAADARSVFCRTSVECARS